MSHRLQSVTAKRLSSHGNTSVFNLLIIVLVGALVYILYTRERLDSYLPEDYRYATRFASNAEESGDDATPAPANAAAPANDSGAPKASLISSPAPSTPAASSAAPAGRSLSEYSAVPRAQWPRQVAVMREMEVQIISGGRVAGSMKAKPGTLFELVEIQGENVQIRAGGELKVLPASETDALFRFRQIGK